MAEPERPGGSAQDRAGAAQEQARKAGRETQERGAELARDAQGRAADTAREAADKGGAVAQEAQEKAGKVASRAQDRAAEVVGKAQQGAADIASTVRDKLEPQKEEAADALDTAAERGWDAAHKLRDMDQRWLSQMVGLGAEELSGIADRVRDNDLGGLLQHLRTVSHRQPAVFAGASVAAGFALARMARFAMEDGSASFGSSRMSSTDRGMAETDTMPRAESALGTGQATATTETAQTTPRPGVSAAQAYPGANYNE